MRIHRRFFTESPAGRYPFIASRIPERAIRLLDVGNAGAGYSSHARLRQLVEERGGLVVGCDRSTALAVAEAHPRQVVGDAVRLPFPDFTFDVVYMGEVIEHLWSPRDGLQEVHRVLKVGGRLLLDTPNVLSLSRIVNWWLRHLDEIGDPTHTFLFSPAVLGNLLSSGGFSILEMHTDRKLQIGPMHVPWLLGRRRLGSHLLVVAERQ